MKLPQSRDSHLVCGPIMDSKRTTTNSPIAVVGMACRLPQAPDLRQFWQVVRDGIQTERPVPAERLNREYYYHPDKGQVGKTYTDLACLIDYRPPDLQRFPHLAPLREFPEPTHATLCEVAAEAFEHAGYLPDALDGTNTAVYIGHTRGCPLAGELSFLDNSLQIPSLLRQVKAYQTVPDSLRSQIEQRFQDELSQERKQQSHTDYANLYSYVGAHLISRCFIK